MLDVFEESDVIPVIAPLGIGARGETYNINADTAAGAIADALGARRLLMLTDVPGVLDGDGNLIPRMTADEVRAGIESGMISGGMIPKVETCLNAIKAAGAVYRARRRHADYVRRRSRRDRRGRVRGLVVLHGRRRRHGEAALAVALGLIHRLVGARA